MSRGVLLLILIAAGLGLYLWLVEMPAEQKRAATDTAAHTLLDFKEADVQGFTLTSPQGEVEIIRNKDGRWAINKPTPMEADEAAVGEFLRTLSLAQVLRVVDESGTDLPSYGLASPTLFVSLRLTASTPAMRLGDSGPLSATLYAMREGSPRIFLTSLSRRDLQMATFQDFRRKRVFLFDRNQVTRIKLATGQETIALYKNGHGEKAEWTIKAPSEAKADQPEVKSLLFGLEDLKAQRFVDDPRERGAVRAGLGQPFVTFTLREGEQDRTLTVFLDPRNKAAAYAESDRRGPLYQISPAVARDLAKDLFALRVKQLIASEPDRVKTLVIKTGGQDYSLTRDGGNWLVDGDPNAKTDAARLNMLVSRAVRLQAERIVTEKPADLKTYGLAPPAMELIVADEQGKLLGRIAFGKQTEGLAYAMGSAMPGVFQVRPDILKEIPQKDDLLTGQSQQKKPKGGP